MTDEVEAVRAANDRFYRAFESLSHGGDWRLVHHHASHILAVPGSPQSDAP